MSLDLIVFLVGAAVFAITVYGSVMAAGLKLTRAKIAESPDQGNDIDPEELDKLVPQVKY